MATIAQPTRTSTAFAVATAGIALFSLMDALMKGLSLAIGTYNALLWRTLLSAGMAGLVFLVRRSPWPGRQAMRVHLVRGSMSTVMAILFFWGLARVPMAQAIALAFVAPLIALYLAAIILKERIERSAILASLLGFAGVVVILAGQAEADLGPEAFRGSLAILASAALYAWNIILMRQQALLAEPVEIAFFTSLIMAIGFLLLAPLLAVPPPPEQVPQIVGAAVLAFGSLLLLSWAYARAEAQYLAPVEYTGFIWASLFGFLFFAEPVRPLTLVGAAMIVAACLYAARPSKAPLPGVEGFRNIPWTIAFLVSVTLSMGLLEYAARTIPMGTAYAVWGGIGALGTVLVGAIWFGEPLGSIRILLLLGLIGCIVGLRLVSA